MATFIQRCMQEADFNTDGDSVPLDQLRAALSLYNDGRYTQAQVGALFSNTAAQQTELVALLATRPGQQVDRANWVERVSSTLLGGLLRWPGLTTAALVKTALGVA